MLPPKGHHCETEYRRSYKQSRYICSATTYRQNLDFRKEQKRRFVEHNTEPFVWDPDDIESEPGSDESCDELNKSSNLTHTQYKHEKLNRLYQKYLTGRQDSSTNTAESKGVHSSNQSRQVSDTQVETVEDYKDSGSESEASVVHVIEPEFVKKSSTKFSSPIVDKQTQTERKVQKKCQEKSPAPFIPYGYEAGAKETGKKFTHNVRAARQIYPSALRAQRMRTTKASEDSRCESRNGRTSHGPDLLRKASSEPVRVLICSGNYDNDDDSPHWMTEYDRNYQPYPEKEYRKGISSLRGRANDLTPRVSSHTSKPIHK